VVDTALAHFRRQGFEATSIDAVAASCKASKHTIYRRYPNKEALFIAAVQRERQTVQDSIRKVDTTGLDAFAALHETCAALFEVAVSPGNADLYRMCIGAVLKFPMIGEQFVESERQMQNLLEPLVRRAQAEGILISGDSRALCNQLYYAIIGEIWLHALLGKNDVSDVARRGALFEANWQMFMDGRRLR
jgi:AcrR family transcriptional regulator